MSSPLPSETNSDQENDPSTSNSPLNAIQPDTWLNIPPCLVNAIQILVKEAKTFDSRMKFTIDKMNEGQKKLDSTSKRIEKEVSDIDQRLEKQNVLQKEEILKISKATAYDTIQINEKVRQALLLTSQFDEKLTRIIYESQKYIERTELEALEVSINQKLATLEETLKEFISQTITENLEIPGLCGKGKMFIDLRALVKDIYFRFEGKTKLIDEINNNKDQFFQSIISDYIGGMNLATSIRNEIETDMKYNLMRELSNRMDDKIRSYNNTVEQYVKQYFLEHMESFKEINNAEYEKLNNNLKNLQEEQIKEIEKVCNNVYNVETRLVRMTKDTNEVLFKYTLTNGEKIQDIHNRLDNISKTLTEMGTKIQFSKNNMDVSGSQYSHKSKKEFKNDDSRNKLASRARDQMIDGINKDKNKLDVSHDISKTRSTTSREKVPYEDTSLERANLESMLINDQFKDKDQLIDKVNAEISDHQVKKNSSSKLKKQNIAISNIEKKMDVADDQFKRGATPGSIDHQIVKDQSFNANYNPDPGRQDYTYGSFKKNPSRQKDQQQQTINIDKDINERYDISTISTGGAKGTLEKYDGGNGIDMSMSSKPIIANKEKESTNYITKRSGNTDRANGYGNDHTFNETNHNINAESDNDQEKKNQPKANDLLDRYFGLNQGSESHFDHNQGSDVPSVDNEGSENYLDNINENQRYEKLNNDYDSKVKLTLQDAQTTLNQSKENISMKLSGDNADLTLSMQEKTPKSKMIMNQGLKKKTEMQSPSNLDLSKENIKQNNLSRDGSQESIENFKTQQDLDTAQIMLQHFDLTKLEPDTIVFLKIMESELMDLHKKFNLIKEELAVHLKYHLILASQNGGLGGSKIMLEDYIKKEYLTEKKDKKKPNPFRMTAYEMLKRISKKRETEEFLRDINQKSKEKTLNPEPLIEIKSQMQNMNPPPLILANDLAANTTNRNDRPITSPSRKKLVKLNTQIIEEKDEVVNSGNRDSIKRPRALVISTPAHDTTIAMTPTVTTRQSTVIPKLNIRNKGQTNEINNSITLDKPSMSPKIIKKNDRIMESFQIQEANDEKGNLINNNTPNHVHFPSINKPTSRAPGKIQLDDLGNIEFKQEIKQHSRKANENSLKKKADLALNGKSVPSTSQRIRDNRVIKNMNESTTTTNNNDNDSPCC